MHTRTPGLPFIEAFRQLPTILSLLPGVIISLITFFGIPDKTLHDILPLGEKQLVAMGILLLSLLIAVTFALGVCPRNDMEDA